MQLSGEMVIPSGETTSPEVQEVTMEPNPTCPKCAGYPLREVLDEWLAIDLACICFENEYDIPLGDPNRECGDEES